MEANQDGELFLVSDHNGAALQDQVDRLLETAPRLSPAEFVALAADLAQTRQEGSVRAAIVAANGPELAEGLLRLKAFLANNVTTYLDLERGIFVGEGHTAPRIGFLFPGQGAPPYLDGGLARQRFDFVDALYTMANLPADSQGGATRVDQPAIITSSLAAIQIMQRLGITASLGIGHSLGELTALHWAGAMDAPTLLHLTRVRANAMSSGNPTGAMANICASSEYVQTFFDGGNVFIAGITAPQLTVIAGEASAVTAVVERTQAENIRSFYLGVPHAFHTPLIADEVQSFVAELARTPFQPLRRRVISTVTAKPLEPNVNIADLLYRQVISTVQLRAAVELAARNLDLFIEIGAGKLISTFAGLSTPLPAMTIDVGGPSFRSLLNVVGLVFALGSPVQTDILFADRVDAPIAQEYQV